MHKLAAAVLVIGILLLAGAVTGVAAGNTGDVPCGLSAVCPIGTTTTTTGNTGVPYPASTTTTTTTTTTSSPAVPGGSYEGLTTDPRDWAALTVGSSGHSVTGLRVSFEHGSCSDGEGYGSAVSWTAPFPVSASGVASRTVGWYKAYTVLRHGTLIVRGTEKTSVTLVFAPDTVVWVIHDWFSAHGLTCSSGLVRFTAYRAGSAKAPLRNATTDSGEYSGASGKVWVQLPLALITEIRFTAQIGCADGSGLAHPVDLYALGLHGDRFSMVGHEHVATQRGGSGVGGYVLVGNFSQADGQYVVRWRWTEHQTLYDAHGHRLTSCGISGEQFAAGGPATVPSTQPASPGA